MEFPEGCGGFRQNPFHEGGLDIFWNYTLLQKIGGLGFNLLQFTQVILIFSFCIKICWKDVIDWSSEVLCFI